DALVPPPHTTTRSHYTTLFRSYDQKWIEKLCVQNYYIGAVVVEMYTHAEHLQKNTEVKTRRDCTEFEGCDDTCVGCGNCTGALRLEEHTSELQSRENLVCRLLL